jgi:hypothetical protein
MSHDFKAGDTAELKQERPTLAPVYVTIIERNQRYAGWTVTLPSGHTGIALDSELRALP